MQYEIVLLLIERGDGRVATEDVLEGLLEVFQPAQFTREDPCVNVVDFEKKLPEGYMPPCTKRVDGESNDSSPADYHFYANTFGLY